MMIIDIHLNTLATAGDLIPRERASDVEDGEHDEGESSEFVAGDEEAQKVVGSFDDDVVVAVVDAENYYSTSLRVPSS